MLLSSTERKGHVEIGEVMSGASNGVKEMAQRMRVA